MRFAPGFLARVADDCSMPAFRNLDVLAPFLDVPGALRRLGDDVELLEQIILIFLEDAPGLILSAREAVANGNAAELRRSAHSVKGMMATIGAQVGQNAAFRLEQCAAGGDLAEASGLIQDCGARVAELAQALQTYLDSGDVAASRDHSSASAS
jgi:HPt (histidine-containing phosphotransfer) domain-containing protein